MPTCNKTGGNPESFACRGDANGDRASKLEVVGEVGKRNTGTTLRFWPDEKYFDSAKFSIPRLKHVLRAKAVLCPGLHVSFTDEKTGEEESWLYAVLDF